MKQQQVLAVFHAWGFSVGAILQVQNSSYFHSLVGKTQKIFDHWYMGDKIKMRCNNK